jgi:integrase
MAVRSKNKDKHIIDLRPWGYKGKRVRLPFDGTYEDALRYHNEVQAQFGKENTFLDRTVSVIAEEYLEWVQTHQAPKTHLDKKKMLWGHLLPYFGPMKTHLLTRTMLDSYKKKRLSEPGRYRKTRAVNLELLCMTHMLKWGSSRGYCEEPPKTDKVPHFKGLPDVLTPEEVSRLLDNMDSSFYFTLFSTVYYCGLRKDEALGLTWGAVNLDAGYLRIRGKGNRERLVPVPVKLSKIVTGYARLVPGPLLPDRLVVPLASGGLWPLRRKEGP